MKPDSKNHNPDPAYIDGLVKSTGLQRTEVARLLGISDRTLRTYTSGETATPYLAQFALEALTQEHRKK